MWVMDRQVELDRKKETKWMANISSPITYMICMAVFGMYQDSRVSFEVYRTIKRAKWEDVESEEYKQTETISYALIDLFDSIYDKSNWSEEFDMSVLDAIILWNWFGGIWYEKSDDNYEVIWENWETIVIEEKISMPNIYRIVPLNFFTELSARTQQSAKLNIVRKIMTEKTINKEYEIYWKTFIPSKNEKREILIEKDWNMVLRFLMFNNMPNVTDLDALGMKNTYWNSNWTWEQWQQHTDIWSDNSYSIGEDLHEVYEVHTDTTMQVFIDWQEYWIFKRLWPRKKKPYFKIWFRKWLNWLYDMWVGLIWYQYHKVLDWFLNLRIDNDRLVASQPVLINSDETTFDWFDVLSMYPWKILKVKDINQSLKPAWLASNSWTVANSEVDMLGKTVQDAVGVSWYKMGIQQKVERSAKWVQELVDSVDASMKSFIASIAEAKWFISKYTILLALQYMDDDSIVEMSWINLKEELWDLTSFINDYKFNYNMQSISSLRERQELEMIKWLVRDYAWVTRPSWTPVLNQDEAFKLILEKTNLPSDLYLSEDDAKEYMEKSIEVNADLKKKESELMPQPPMQPQAPAAQQWAEMQGIVPDVWVEWMTVWAQWAPWVQAWSSWEGMAQTTNPLWNNQTTWQI